MPKEQAVANGGESLPPPGRKLCPQSWGCGETRGEAAQPQQRASEGLGAMHPTCAAAHMRWKRAH